MRPATFWSDDEIDPTAVQFSGVHDVAVGRRRAEPATRGAARGAPDGGTAQCTCSAAGADCPGRPRHRGNTSLSSKLSRNQGTLQPPAVDPGINVPVPPQSQGTMPVIPPPGSPGGDQKIVPK